MTNKEGNNNSVSTSPNTKEIIMSAAKQQFSEHGYFKTTIANIFKDIDVPMGVFTYHFKTKSNLVSEILTQFYRKIEELVDNNFNIQPGRSFLKHILVSRIYYKIILEDKKNSRFFYEVTQEQSSYKYFKNVIIPKHRSLLNEFNVRITEEEFQSIVIIGSGGRREFYMNYSENNITMSVNQVVDLLESIVPRLLKIDQSLIDSILLESIDMVKSLDYSAIKFLV